MKKLYVGNLNFNLSNDDLKAKFEEFGSVISANIITDRKLVVQKDSLLLKWVILTAVKKLFHQLNGQEFQVVVIVNEARPSSRRQTTFSGGNRGGFNS